ncbi:MAG: DUF480 domain-containing protein [Pirellulaceae bacterium]
MTETNPADPNTPKELEIPALQRRILGVLVEKARTTPDSYPLSLNGLVTGCNQKSNRYPLMNVNAERVEDELILMREKGMIAEVHGGGRVPKYRHYMSDFLSVQGMAGGVLTELLLRGEQTVGDLRSRASRFGAIPDQAALQEILNDLIEKGLAVALTPPGRGQMVTHNLYASHELDEIKTQVASGEIARPAPTTSAAPKVNPNVIESMTLEIQELKSLVQALDERLKKLES